MTEAVGLIVEANGKAAEHSSETNRQIIEATQQIFKDLISKATPRNGCKITAHNSARHRPNHPPPTS